MTTKISNKEKILIVLKKLDVKITSKDLAEYTNIGVKNIGRYLNKLVDNKYISRKTIQIGKKRYIENKILAKGKNFKFTSTYDDVKKQIANEILKPETETKEFVDNSREIKELSKGIISIEQEKTIVNNINGKETYKTELLSLIKVIAIRDVDAQSIGMKNKQELTNRIVSLILKL